MDDARQRKQKIKRKLTAKQWLSTLKDSNTTNYSDLEHNFESTEKADNFLQQNAGVYQCSLPIYVYSTNRAHLNNF